MIKRVMTVVGVGATTALVVGVTAAFAGGPGDGQSRHPDKSGVISSVAEELGITGKELRTQVGDGTSIAQLAEEAGIDLQAIVDAALTERAEKVDEAVSDGRITQEQADDILARSATRLDDMLNQEGLGGHMFGGGRGRFGHSARAKGNIVAEVSEGLGMTPAELHEEVGDDKSVAQVAEEVGADLDAIVDSIITNVEEKLSEAVDTERITQERADEMLVNFETKLTDKLNEPGGFAPRHQGNGRHGRGGFNGRGMGPRGDHRGAPNVASHFENGRFGLGSGLQPGSFSGWAGVETTPTVTVAPTDL